MEFDDPAPGAGLDVSGQLDVDDEFVVLVDAGIGQQELGQSKQRLALTLDKGRVARAYSLGLGWLETPPSIEAVRVLTKHPRPGHPLSWRRCAATKRTLCIQAAASRTRLSAST